MNFFAAPILLLALTFLFGPSRLLAQEENDMVVKQGTRYLDLKLKSLNKFDSRIERQQDQLLKKLKKKERRFANKLKNSDSSAYNRYKEQPVSYDSISKVSKNDTNAVVAQSAKKNNTSVGKLKGIEGFIESKTGSRTPEMAGRNAELDKLQSHLNKRNLINDLISKRATELKSISTSGKQVPILTGIQKQVFYGKSRMKAYQEIEEEPDKAEDKAMEYLEGTAGFDKYLKNSQQDGVIVMQGDSKAIEAMGFQTKNVLQNSLLKKFGAHTGTVVGQMGSGVAQLQEMQKQIPLNGGSAKDITGQIKNNEMPSFRVNPMRGLPFCKRIEKQYTFQATKAIQDKQPALLNLSATAGFKQTPRLIYGIGIISNFGLGENWQNIHFSFQGIGAKCFINWEWQFGIGAYTGYERAYKQILALDHIPADAISPSLHNSSKYNESALIGLTKKYKVTNKWNGQIQVLYDVWWQQKKLTTPFVLRFATINK